MRHFARHYLEMWIVMLLGMVVLWVPARMALGESGVSSAELHRDLPALMILGMAMTMTVPMIAWMRHRGHGWAASHEMAAAMMLPALGVVGLLAAGLVTDMGVLMTIEHVAMGVAMLGVMLARRAEYSHAHHAVAA